jgi:uncharacterized membrane protein YcjF (UPF0283 family)
MTDERDVLSALMDRERVDPVVLARVLDDPASRALLVDFARLRHALAAEPESEPALTSPLPHRSRYGRTALRAAAVLLMLAVGTAGGAWLQKYRSQERPPQPDRIVTLEPVAASEK